MSLQELPNRVPDGLAGHKQTTGIHCGEDLLLDYAGVSDAVSFEQQGNLSGKVGLLHGFVRNVVRHKWFLLLLLLMVFSGGLHALRQHGDLTPDRIVEFLQAHPLQAPLVFLVVYALSVVCLIPTLPLNLGAGLIWGPYEGGLIAVLGASMGAALAFLIARHVVYWYFQVQLSHAVVRWFRREIESKGWKAVAFMRMNPLFPFSLSSYCLGLTSINFSRLFDCNNSY